MKPAGRLLAAIDVLDDILNRHRPAAAALADWGRSHRFAGSGDRAAIGNLVYDALRRRASLTWRMGSESPRALALGCLRWHWQVPVADIAGLCDGARHAPASLDAAERDALDGAAPAPGDMPPWVAGDYPQWLHPALTACFGTQAAAEGEALAGRAPIDLRVNSLRTDRPRLLKALQRFDARPTPWSPLGVRIAAPAATGRSPHVEAEAAHGKGWFEVQDEGSQLAALLSGAGPRCQVADLCAGSGGKTLAMAAMMANTGQVFSYDADRLRLRPIFERLRRAGVRNVQVLPGGDGDALEALTSRMDVVFVDAPCSGSGVWRRRPDAKWRLSPEALGQRRREQRAVLRLAAPLVRPGGRLVYVTCSLLPEENADQVAWFLGAERDFTLIALPAVWRAALNGDAPASADGAQATLLLTPARHGTDGFFIAVLSRREAAG